MDVAVGEEEGAAAVPKFSEVGIGEQGMGNGLMLVSCDEKKNNIIL